MTNNLPFFVYASRECGLDSAKNLNLERMEYLQIQNPRRKLDGARGGLAGRISLVVMGLLIFRVNTAIFRYRCL